MTYLERIFDATSGETIERNYDSKEIAELEKEQIEADKRVKAQNAKTIAKDAALAKLAALGLTTDDLKALGLGNN